MGQTPDRAPAILAKQVFLQYGQNGAQAAAHIQATTIQKIHRAAKQGSRINPTLDALNHCVPP